LRAFWLPFAHSTSNNVTSWVSDIASAWTVLEFKRSRIIHLSPLRASAQGGGKAQEIHRA